MKPVTIRIHGDKLEFIFNHHERELRRFASRWFADKLSDSSPQERLNLSERAFVVGESFGHDLARSRFTLSLQRTLRVPDDGRDYPLPAGLGNLPLRSLRSCPSPVIPAAWRKQPTGLVCLHPAEATWLSFGREGPFAVQVAAGGVCAVSGTAQVHNTLRREPQNYLVTPEQPWLDGFRVSPKVIRQFVAMPMGKGFSVEQQVTGAETIGGLQLRVVPAQVEILWEKHLRPLCELRWESLCARVLSVEEDYGRIEFCKVFKSVSLAAGGCIKQEIYTDPHPSGMWDETQALSCVLRLIDARDWKEITGEEAPTAPPSPQEYASAGIPWFDYANGDAPIAGAAPLAGVKSVATLFAEKTGLDLPDNDPVEIHQTIKLGP